MEQQEVRNIGWRVTLAGIGINLALGVLYSWSVLKAAIPAEWKWTDFQKTLPYSVACLVFAIVMVPAGRVQDRIGPRWVALAGGVAVGLGMILASFYTKVTGCVLGFGVLAGAGIGMGYAAATPAAVKWFPPRKTGMIAGLVVAGFGLASVYISPLANHLIYKTATVAMSDGGQKTMKFIGDINASALQGGKVLAMSGLGLGIQPTMWIFGIAFLVIVAVLSQFLAVPPAGWKPAVAASAGGGAAKPSVEYTWQEMLATPQFYLMWVMYLFAAGAGLMIIASLASIVKLQAKTEAGFLFVALLAIGNASGRIIAGTLSDKIGRRATMMIVFLFQAALMFILSRVSEVWAFVVISMLLGANYGANLALFPAATKDYFGLKNFGVNYGWVFTAWGVGAVVLAQISGKVRDVTGNYNLAYLIAGGGLLAAAVIGLMLRAPDVKRAVAATGGADAAGSEPVSAGALR